MSSSCIYKEFAICIPAEKIGYAEDMYLLISLVGSSNSYDFNGRRSRSWAVTSMGDKAAIIAGAIHVAGGFAGQMCYFGNFGKSGAIAPDAYISKVRQMLEKANKLDDTFYISFKGDALMLKRKSDRESLNWEFLKSQFDEYHQAGQPFQPTTSLAVFGSTR